MDLILSAGASFPPLNTTLRVEGTASTGLPLRVVFSGPGQRRLTLAAAKRLAEDLLYGSRARRRAAERYLQRHQIAARSGLASAELPAPAATCRFPR